MQNRFVTMVAATVLLPAVFTKPAEAQPSITPNGIVNNGSFAPYGHINGGLAQGSLVAIFGSGLGPEALVKADSFPLRTELGGTSVRAANFAGAVDAWPIYVSAGQIGVLLPSNTPLGTTRFTVTYRGQTSAPVEADVVRRNFGAFTAGSSGAGAVIATNYISESNQPLNTIFQPARPGQLVTLWGTGLGPVSGDESARPLPGNLDLSLQVMLGDATAIPLYQGRSGCCAGLDQIVFPIPAGVEGCHVPVVIRAGNLVREGQPPPAEGAVTATATISISASGEPCSDPLGLTAEDVRGLQTRGSIRAGWLWMEKSAAGATVKAAFARLDAAAMLSRIGIFGLPDPGSCIEGYTAAGGFDYPLSAALDPGPALTLSGPGGEIALRLQEAGRYAATGLNLPAGTYTLSNGQGGKDVGAFSASIELKQPLTWMNMAAAPEMIPYFRWSGGDPSGYAILNTMIKNDVGQSLSLCAAPGSAGNFSIGGVFVDASVATAKFGLARVDENFGMLSLFRFTAPGLDLGLAGTVQFHNRKSTFN